MSDRCRRPGWRGFGCSRSPVRRSGQPNRPDRQTGTREQIGGVPVPRLRAMPTPQFILDLRAKVGHDMLWLPGCTAVVFDDDGRVLLVRRADNGRWALVTGILEPGEQPAVGALREVEEETGVIAEAERLLSVTALPRVEYYNGDQTTYLDVTFRCRYISGEARVNDDESSDVGWFALDELPALPERHTACIKDALMSETTPARFALS
jgi:8-oxo-dGTP pyrophosphatase MutT (NUDIX family)